MIKEEFLLICEKCQNRPATLHFTEIINGQKNETHLCEECAKENSEFISESQDPFSFHHLLSGLLNFDQMISNNTAKKSTEAARCNTCGLTFGQFKKMGKFGCNDCYKYFESQLEPIFRRIHGNSRHSGKFPIRTGGKIKIRKEFNLLKTKLQEMVAAEEFEEAAKIRDEIKALELKLSDERG